MTPDLSPLRLLLVTLAGWVNRQQEVIDYQGLGNRLIVPIPRQPGGTRVRCHERVGGRSRYYYRAA